jgi:hypothetical protein
MMIYSSLANDTTNLPIGIRYQANKISFFQVSDVVPIGTASQRNVVTVEHMSLPQMPFMIAIVVLSFLVLVLLVSLVRIQKKHRKMQTERTSRESLLQAYLSHVDNLKTFLRQKNLLPAEPHLKDKLEHISETIKELVNKYLNEEDRGISITQELNHTNGRLEKTLEENRTLKMRLEALQGPGTVSTPNYIKADIMLSAGPRKDAGSDDTELGEDVAGILSIADQTFFWLLDGTSDSAVLKDRHEESKESSHIFSSRLLAQNLGYYIQKHITAGNNLEGTLAAAQYQIKEDWTERINGLPLEQKEVILRHINNGFKPTCSATVIIGRLHQSGYLNILRSGDSKAVAYSRNMNVLTELKCSQDPGEENDRIFFQLDYDNETGRFDLKCNTPRSSIEDIKDVSCLLVFTDGIGKLVEKQLLSNRPGIIDSLRLNMGRIQQKTYDDKTLIFLERITNS